MNPVKPDPSAPSNIHYRADNVAMSEDNCGFIIKLVHQSINRMLDQEMAPLDLTAMQWRPLAMIHKGRADTSAELARVIGVDTGAMTRTLDRLEAKGLLRRVRSSEDRRVVKLELTEAGLNKAREIPAYIAKALNSHLRGFSQEEVRQLRHLLSRMLANGSSNGAAP
ncbi:MarR family winged helix-turn-helix transcriptional regulator [Bordetella avium]|uniref:Multiple antibiotic resistance protein n=1 Tax=Bordetella avium (strain 197N) TaxID=360910 RepID=Q2KYZ3_BORA1|nr:MarR family transcriptional regulator [Bordetella avium]AZY49497.1 MarR family transcriptional regulator [Bordetella avium]AZY52893.1 MarR family transcriptional regulator [Bordetella avium]RIQ11726.1 MarR family transcriptional regulator [Bordetella avium]RIQ16149.1 MarR family transcriptional regulator [Bordetella avium]RIQ30302.1 MarR family transcriptional regulator [Bordetella avium]